MTCTTISAAKSFRENIFLFVGFPRKLDTITCVYWTIESNRKLLRQTWKSIKIYILVLFRAFLCHWFLCQCILFESITSTVLLIKTICLASNWLIYSICKFDNNFDDQFFNRSAKVKANSIFKSRFFPENDCLSLHFFLVKDLAWKFPPKKHQRIRTQCLHKYFFLQGGGGGRPPRRRPMGNTAGQGQASVQSWWPPGGHICQHLLPRSCNRF